jgi:probable HAF family extracellular repeat protein
MRDGKKGWRLRLVAVGLVVALNVGAAPAATEAGAGRCRPADRTSTDLGTLGGVSTLVSDINDRGQVVGGSETASGGTHAFGWQRGAMRDLTPSAPASVTTTARAINEHGQVLIDIADGDTYRSVLWVRGRTVDITDGTPGVYAHALNDRGQVVVQRPGRLELWDAGTVTTIIEASPPSSVVFTDLSDHGHVAFYRITPASHGMQQIEAFVWRNGVLQLLRPPNPEGAWITYIEPIPVAVDDRGRVLVNVVKSDPVNGWAPGALLWDDGTFTDLGTLRPGLGTAWTTGAAMDNHGRVVGTATAPDGNEHAFLWARGQLTDLGTLPGDHSSNALEISDRGHVIGISNGAAGERGFLWSCHTMVALGTTNHYPVDVNSRGHVITSTTSPTGEHRALIWTPTRR